MFSKKNMSNSDASLKKVETIIGCDCEIIGDIKVGNSIKIDGIVHGKIYAEGDVVIGEKGKIKGDIECKELKIHGNIEGDIDVDTLRLRPTSCLSGNIKAGILEIEHGSKYLGTVTMKAEDTPIQTVNTINPNSYTLNEDSEESEES